MGKLTAAKVKALLEKPGRYSDGDGLLLFVRRSEKTGAMSASWVVRAQCGGFGPDGKRMKGARRDIGLGSAKFVGLAEAREKAWEVRRTLRAGGDPRLLWKTPAALLQTFEEAATLYLEKGCKAGDQRRLVQYPSQLKKYAYPSLGKLQVQSINANLIADCLRPVWTSKPVVAGEVRRLIISALSFARPDAGAFESDLSRAIAARLPTQPRSGNFDALPYQDVPALVERLKPKTGIAALALRLLILCASRSGEVRGATWDEIDFERAVWTIPADRMKMRKPHKVPLSPQALAVLEQAKAIRRSDQVFPNGKGEALSDMALTKTLRDMELACTAHGFRSSFRDWAAEQTSVAGEVAEAALAHAVPNAVEAAYKRTDFFDLRRDLMNAWGRFATGEGSAEIVQMEMRAHGL
jgi:integrase